MSRRGATLSMAGVLALGLGLGAAQLKVPYVGLGPGPVTDTLGSVDGKPLIEIKGRTTYPASGRLDLTTVNVYSDLDLVTALEYWFDRNRAVVPREVVFPPDQTPEESEEQNRRDMEESQEHAVTAALTHLKIPFTTQLLVSEVVASSGAAAAGIKAGDTVLTVDGQPVGSFAELQQVIARHKPGEKVVVTYRREGVSHNVDVTTKPSPDDASRPVIGVNIEEKHVYPFTVTIRLQDVGGPSAGLLFALGIVDLLTPGDLTGGKHIAGTGTIDDTGTVGPIGGIQQKLIAAKNAGASHFLVPAGNWADAMEAKPDGLALEKVGTLDEAVSALGRIARS